MKMVADWALTRLCSRLADAHRVTELEGQLARTQEWLERFQGGMATWNLKAEALWDLVDEADSYIGLVVHRYPGGVPTDMRENMAEWRRKAAAGSRGRVGTVDKAGPNPAGETHAGSTPAAPTGAVRMSGCPLCGSARSVHGNVASCISCGGGLW